MCLFCKSAADHVEHAKLLRGELAELLHQLPRLGLALSRGSGVAEARRQATSPSRMPRSSRASSTFGVDFGM